MTQSSLLWIVKLYISAQILLKKLHNQTISRNVTQERAEQGLQQQPEQELWALKIKWTVGRNEWLIIIILSIVSLMVAPDATILVTALPVSAVKGFLSSKLEWTYTRAISSDLRGDATDTFRTGESNLLTQSDFQHFFISLSDLFSRRYFYLISLGFFTVNILLCCLCKTFSELLSGRSIQGVGGGGILALGHVIIADMIPLRQRPIYRGFLQTSWAIGSISVLWQKACSSTRQPGVGYSISTFRSVGLASWP